MLEMQFILKGQSKERRNKGLPPGRSVLNERKTRQYQGRASSHVFVAIKTITPVWACTAITDASLPSAAEV